MLICDNTGGGGGGGYLLQDCMLTEQKHCQDVQ